MSFVFRPAKREDTPLIIGIAGPTKSGKTYSALRLAQGLANGGTVAMLNAEGKRGEQYADKFNYVNCNIDMPYSPERYTEALTAMKSLNPAVGIIDSASHMHDGPGGLLEYHDAELDRLSKGDDAKRERNNFTAWIKPKAAENQFIYAMLGCGFPIILCFRAKEKLKIQGGGRPPIDLGWQPIAGERIAFETIFTLMLPPHSKGVPDLEISEMREPFDTLVPKGKPIDESLGKILMDWSKNVAAPLSSEDAEFERDVQTACSDAGAAFTSVVDLLKTKRGYASLAAIPGDKRSAVIDWIKTLSKKSA